MRFFFVLTCSIALLSLTGCMPPVSQRLEYAVNCQKYNYCQYQESMFKHIIDNFPDSPEAVIARERLHLKVLEAPKNISKIRPSSFDVKEYDPQYEDRFRIKSGRDSYSVIFDYIPATKELSIVDVGGDTSRSTVDHENNEKQLRDKGVITDCVRAEYNYSAAKFNYYDCTRVYDNETLTVLNKKEFLKNRYTPDNDAIERFGKAANRKLGEDSSNSCEVTKAGISGWYSGSCKDGFADGEGVAVGVDRYSGTFKNGVMEGTGVYINEWKGMYTGQVTGNKLTGFGHYEYYGDSYQSYRGEVVDARRQGNGVLTTKKGRIERGYFLQDRLLSDAEYVTYRCSIDAEFCRGHNHDVYTTAFSNAKTSQDFENFITNYRLTDSDNLIPQARIAKDLAIRKEMADELAAITVSYGYDGFIEKHKAYDPDKLVAKAKNLKKSALMRDKAEYSTVINQYWSPDFKVKVTFTAAPGKASQLLQQVKDAVKVRDPFGLFNPYWVPTFQAAAAYDTNGVVIGEWYTGYYDGYSEWLRHLTSEMNALKTQNLVSWNVVALGDMVRPSSGSSNYAAPVSSGSSSTTSSAPAKGVRNVTRDGNYTYVVCNNGRKETVEHLTSGWSGYCTYPNVIGKYSCDKAIQWTKDLCNK